jgi:hypothetical protein
MSRLASDLIDELAPALCTAVQSLSVDDFVQGLCTEVESLRFISDNETIFRALAQTIAVANVVYQCDEVEGLTDKPKCDSFNKALGRAAKLYLDLDPQSEARFRWNLSKEYGRLIDVDRAMVALLKAGKALRRKKGRRPKSGTREAVELLEDFWRNYVNSTCHCVFEDDKDNSLDGNNFELKPQNDAAQFIVGVLRGISGGEVKITTCRYLTQGSVRTRPVKVAEN